MEILFLSVVILTLLQLLILIIRNNEVLKFKTKLNHLTYRLSINAVLNNDKNHERFYQDFDKIKHIYMVLIWWKPFWKFYIGTSLEQTAKSLRRY